jgi:hypothetical protein
MGHTVDEFGRWFTPGTGFEDLVTAIRSSPVITDDGFGERSVALFGSSGNVVRLRFKRGAFPSLRAAG